VKSALAVLCALLLVGGCGGEDEEGADGTTGEAAEDTATHESAEPVTVTLAEANDSGKSGTATLTPKEGTIATFEVTLTVTPRSAQAQLAAIHRVTCDDYDPKIPADASLDEIFEAVIATREDELGEVREGKARANVPGSLADRMTGAYSVIVHSPSPPYTPVACGNIPAHE
jgi:hypothetical protein